MRDNRWSLAITGYRGNKMNRLSGDWHLSFPRYSPDQLFRLVSTIEDYPAFVPGYVATRILEKRDGDWRVDNVFGFGPLRSRFESRARFEAPLWLEVTSEDGPWRSFRLRWTLTPEGQGCGLDCRFEGVLRSPMLAALARIALPETERRTISAFERRAALLFG